MLGVFSPVVCAPYLLPGKKNQINIFATVVDITVCSVIAITTHSCAKMTLTKYLDQYINKHITWERIQQHTLDYCFSKNINGIVNVEHDTAHDVDEYVRSKDFKEHIYHAYHKKLPKHIRNQLLLDILKY